MKVGRPATTSVLTLVLFSESLNTFSNIISTFLLSFPGKPVKKDRFIVTFQENKTIQKRAQTYEQIVSSFRRFDILPSLPEVFRSFPGTAPFAAPWLDRKTGMHWNSKEK